MNNQKGSITLEGAISTIVLMAVILTFSSFMKIVHVHGVIQYALIQTASEISQYSYFYSLSGINEINNTIVSQGNKGSKDVSEGINEIEKFLGEVGNGTIVKPNMEKLNPKEMIIALSKALEGELYSSVKTISLNHIIAMPLLKSYLPEDADVFFEKNNVIQNGDFAGIDLGKSRYFENSDGYDEIELVAVYQMKVISPIPIFNEVTIAQTAKSRAFFAGKGSAVSSAKTEEIQMSVWELSNFERADIIVEKENIPNNMPSTFEAVRGFNEKTGKASTYITLDLNSDSYKGKPNKIRSKLQEKLNKIEKFKEDKINDISLQSSQIKSVDYYVVVPKNVSKEDFSLFQKEIKELGKTIKLSDGRNVKLNIIVKQVK